jgi:hypothetical protein
MSSINIFWPVLAQIGLTLAMFIMLGIRKSKAVKAGEVDRIKANLDNRVWPNYVVQVSNNIGNQFEAPVLFYVMCFVFYTVDAVNVLAFILASLFVLSRFAHAYVHIGSNYVPMRFRFFLAGCLILVGMFFLLVWNLAKAA